MTQTSYRFYFNKIAHAQYSLVRLESIAYPNTFVGHVPGDTIGLLDDNTDATYPESTFKMRTLDDAGTRVSFELAARPGVYLCHWAGTAIIFEVRMDVFEGTSI